jgi:hypothetical protein
MRRALLFLMLASLAPRPASAESANVRAVPPALDPEYRHRKPLQLELDASIGTYLGAHLKKSWITGVRSLFHINNLLAVGASFGYARHAVNVLDPPDSLLRERNAYYLSGEVAASTDVALRMGRTVILMDLYTWLAAGARQLNGSWGALGVIGGGVRFYTGLPWLGIRIDVTNYLHSVPLSQGSSFDVDVSFSLGVCFFLPARRSPFERR